MHGIMLKFGFYAVLAFFMINYPAFSQKVGFIASDVIREQFTESKQADQRIRSIVEEWKRELESLEKNIQTLETDIKKNRLVWSDEERILKDKELEDLKNQRMDYARRKFENSGEYDQTVKSIMQPIEEKIYAAVQEVASDEGIDLVWDKSVNTLPYTNFKFDLTVKVLRKLGVDVDSLEKDLRSKIEKDPRNKKRDSKDIPRGRSRERQTEEPTQEGKGQVPGSPAQGLPPDKKEFEPITK